MKLVADRHVLVITYYWPPSGGPGVQRPLKFVKYLYRLGWKVTVLTVLNGEYPVLDKHLAEEIPEGVRVVTAPAISYFQIYKRIMGQKGKGIDTFVLNNKKMGMLGRIARWIRMNLFIPDARIGWVKSAISAGRNIIQEDTPDIIFSTSPPHSLQLIARTLAEESGIPWVADFRDPWTKAFWDAGIKRSHWANMKNLALEQGVLQKANKIIGVSKGVLRLLQAPESKSIVLPNGYDDLDFKNCFEDSPNSKFTIVYAGFMAYTQNPINFFKALSRLPPEYQSQLVVEMYGKQDAVVHDTVNRLSLAPMIQWKGYVPHSEVVKVICKADMLLLVLPKEHGEGILTGKLFEYLATGNFILGIGASSGEAAAIINSCKAGIMIDHDSDPLDILLRQLQNWRKGKKHASDALEIQKYSRKALAKQLSQILDACI